MYGNLKAFAGHDAYNDYAEHLRTLGEPMLPYAGFLWVLRVVLVVALVLHVWTAWRLAMRARQARTMRYKVKKNTTSTFSSRTMRWGGLALLLFVGLASDQLHHREGQVSPAARRTTRTTCWSTASRPGG